MLQKDQAKINKIIMFRAEGWNDASIAEKLGISRERVGQLAGRSGMRHGCQNALEVLVNLDTALKILANRHRPIKELAREFNIPVMRIREILKRARVNRVSTYGRKPEIIGTLQKFAGKLPAVRIAALLRISLGVLRKYATDSGIHLRIARKKAA